MKRIIAGFYMFLGLSLLLVSTQSMAQEVWVEGKHYQALPVVVKTDNPNKLEVLEVFWYGCPHCYQFNNDYLPAWEKSLPEDVYFTLLPATFRGWTEHAKVFYAAKILGKLDVLHQALFDTIQVNPRKYKDVADLKPLFLKHGVTEVAFDQLFQTGGFRKVSQIDQAISQSEQKLNSYSLTGVPALIVNGKYKIGVKEAGGFSNMLKIVDFLLEKERKALVK